MPQRNSLQIFQNYKKLHLTSNKVPKKGFIFPNLVKSIRLSTAATGYSNEIELK